MPNIVRNLVYLDIGYRCLLFDTLQVWKTIFADLKWGAILQSEHSGHINSHLSSFSSGNPI